MRGAQVEFAEGVETQEAITALGIGQELAGSFGEAAAHPLVDAAAKPGHPVGVGHAIADDQVGAACIRFVEKGRNVVGRMLTIAIEGERPGEAAFERAFPAADERRALPQGLRLANDVSARFGRNSLSVVSRGVINDYYRRQMAVDGGDERTDGSGLVEARDDGSAL